MPSRITKNGVTAWSVPAITDTPTLPTTQPGANLDLYVQGCRGQLAPVSFCLRTDRPYMLAVDVPPSCSACQPQADLKYVRCWIQNRNYTGGKDPGLVPELLLKDPALVTVAADGLTNVVRAPCVDADHMLPTFLPANWTQQYWCLVRIPDDCKTGRYTVNINVVRNAVECMVLPVTVDVLPFELGPSPLTYSVYYLGELGRNKTVEQYAADMRSMVAHGITHPLCYENIVEQIDLHDLSLFERVLDIRKAAGIVNDPIYMIKAGMTWSEAGIPQMLFRFRYLQSILAKHGITQLYSQGRDEPQPDVWNEQAVIWRAAQTLGVKTFVAAETNSAGILAAVGNALDLPFFNDAPEVDTKPWHDVGSKVWVYGAVCREKPESLYRRLYGLQAMRRGFDGCCPWAWLDTYGPSPSDDLDSSHKDVMFAFPGAVSPIDTIQYEGYREAQTDVRYAGMLKAMGGVVPSEVGQDLNAVRDTIIGRILLGGGLNHATT